MNPEKLLFGKTRAAILALLYGHVDESFYLRQIVRMSDCGLGPGQRELKHLAASGLITRRVSGHQVYFQANHESPLFPEIKSLMAKTAGIGDVVKTALAPLSDRITNAFIYGSIARGEENKASDIDLMIIGDVSFSEVVRCCRAAQGTLARDINPTVYALSEFRSKLRENHRFLTSVLMEPKIHLIGSDDELERLGKGRMARRS
jgi:uncharacterized protein